MNPEGALGCVGLVWPGLLQTLFKKAGQLLWIVGWVWIVMFWKTTAEKTEKMRTKHTLSAFERFAYFSVFLLFGVVLPFDMVGDVAAGPWDMLSNFGLMGPSLFSRRHHTSSDRM